jgi:hypothetical protein
MPSGLMRPFEDGIPRVDIGIGVDIGGDIDNVDTGIAETETEGEAEAGALG